MKAHSPPRQKLPVNKGLFGVNPEESALVTAQLPLVAPVKTTATPPSPPGYGGGGGGDGYPQLPELSRE